MSSLSFLLWTVSFLAIISDLRGEILTYSNHEIAPLAPEYVKIPKYAKQDVPSQSPGNGRSFIDLSELQLEAICGTEDMNSCGKGASFDLLVLMETDSLPSDGMPYALDDDAGSLRGGDSGSSTSTDASADGDADVISAKGWMDYWPEHEFCCTPAVLSKGLCRENDLNKLIVPVNLPGAYLEHVDLAANVPVKFDQLPMLSHHDIAETGVYILVLASCNPTAAPVMLNGRIESVDPYGYLPADLFGNMPFFKILMCLYTLLAVYWAVVCLRHMEQLIPLQHWIGIVLLLGMIESTAMYAHFEHWNSAGFASSSILFIGLLMGICKRTASRITIMLLSLGYGIVKPSIGEDMPRVMKLGVAYLTASLCYVLATMFPNRHATAGETVVDFSTVLVFIQASIDTVFYVWIIQSINALLASLAARQQGIKYLLYRNFRAVLFLSLFCACVWGLYSGLVIFDESGPNGSDRQWQSRWTVDALWEFVYFLIFVAVAHLWAPTANSQRYAYSVELTQLEDDADYVAAVQEAKVVKSSHGSGEDRALDAEYGGALDDEDEYNVGVNGGALDTASAISKSD